MSATDKMGRKGVLSVAAALNDLGWIFREQPTSDLGIDAQVEDPGEHGRGSGRLIALQIKAGRSWFGEQADGGAVYRGSLDHLRYWMDFSLPVVIVLCNPDKNICYWQSVTSEFVIRTPKAWKIIIPFAQRLDRSAIPAWEALCRKPGTAAGRDSAGQGALRADQPDANSPMAQLLKFSTAYCEATLAKVGKKYRRELYVSRTPDLEIWDELTGHRKAARALVLREKAGSGKTNLVCDLSSRLIAAGYPCVFMLGSEPLTHPRDLLSEVSRALGFEPGAAGHPLPAVAGVRAALDSLPSMPLCILIDAINEARDVDLMRDALNELLAQLKMLPVRVLITCRDIYWDFLKGDWIEIVDTQVRSYDLYRYDVESWPTVRDRYFRAFRIDGQLTGEAEETCRHPLLLRFFCEAYEGEAVAVVTHVRLKPLFEKYLDKKVARLNASRNSLFRAEEGVTQVLQSIAAEMLSTRESSVPEPRVAELTGETGPLTRDSVYVKLLDEDIILDEYPEARFHKFGRRVRFVYEAFLEFMLARELADRWAGLGNGEVMEELVAYLDPGSGLHNVQGALAFLDDFFEARRLSVWRELAGRSPEWQGLVLASLREADTVHLSALLLEAYPTLLNSNHHETRTAAIALLARTGYRELLDPDRKLLFERLETDKHRAVRYAAVQALVESAGSLSPAEQVRVCRAALDLSKPVRKAALKLIRTRKRDVLDRLFPVLCDALRAPQGRIRSFAAMALDLAKWPEARQQLLTCLEDPNSWVRRAALIRLRRHPAEDDVGAVTARLSDAHPGVRALAAILCAEWALPQVLPAIEQQVLVEHKGSILSRLAEAVVDLKPEQSRALLRPMLVHPNYWVRAHAGRGLFASGGLAAVEDLVESFAARPASHWLKGWPGIGDFGGSAAILEWCRARFQGLSLKPTTAAFVAGMFAGRVQRERPELGPWLEEALPELDPPLVEAFLQGLKASDDPTYFARSKAMRPLLGLYVRTGSNLARLSAAYLLGSQADDLSDAELASILQAEDGRVREWFARGINRSDIVGVGWKLIERGRVFLSDDASTNARVPTWRQLLGNPYHLDAALGERFEAAAARGPRRFGEDDPF